MIWAESAHEDAYAIQPAPTKEEQDRECSCCPGNQSRIFGELTHAKNRDFEA